MIKIKTDGEIKKMRKAGHLTYLTHKHLEKLIKPGVTTNELNDAAIEFIKSNNAKPSFLNFNGFPKAICTTLNDGVVHGMPSNYQLQEGDILKIDLGVEYKGYHGDSAWTYVIGKPTQDQAYLLEHTKRALFKGIEQVRPNNTVGDISHAIETYANKYNLGIVKELVGHGIGKDIHEDPKVPNYGKPGTKEKLKPGMVIAIEPMLNLGSAEVYIEDDGWTVKTADHSLSAHFEHTVLVTEEGYEILTEERGS